MKNLKLSTVGWAFISLMIITGVVIIGGAFLIDRNVSVIKNAWDEFQTERSEKSRLEGSLRSSIGFGGMIHDYKNYVLRQEEWYRDHVESHIGAARAILHQYSDLDLTTAEKIAIEDIESVLDEYFKSLRLAEMLIMKQDISIIDLDKALKIDDDPALRGLMILRQEVRVSPSNDKLLNKGRIVADLRAAIGYGGMIHEFKNYILRQDQASIERISEMFKNVDIAIGNYRKYVLNRAEIIALKDIESSLLTYANNVKKIQALVSDNASPQMIDNQVLVDDTLILRGLHVLNREVNAQVAEDSRHVTAAFKLVKQTIQFGKWSTVIFIVIVILLASWLFYTQVINPILRLTKSMTQLANDDFDIEVTGQLQQNEVGQMARAVMYFKENMVRSKEAEKSLAIANEETKQQLKNIQQLRERAEEQTGKAISLAEGLSAARESAEKAMARAEADEELVSSILNTVRDGIITIDSAGTVETFNPGAEDLFGYKAFEVIGQNVAMLMPEPHRSAHDGYLKQFVDGAAFRDQRVPVEQIALRKNGETFPAEITLNTMHVAGKVKVTSLLRDISERKKREEAIELMAMTDSLTGLANRNQYNKHLEEVTKQALRFNTQFALMQIDLDKFKSVNDTYGHPVGDALLQHVAKILLSSCREVDTVARIGGDEFSVILTGINKPEDVTISAERIIEKLSQFVVIEGHNIQIGASIGISHLPDDTTDPEDLIRMADEALYVSKEEGRNTYRIYSMIQSVADSR